MKKLVIFLCALVMAVPFFAEGSEQLSAKYSGCSFHGSMVGKIITADLTFKEDGTIDFTANTPAGKKPHHYTYEVLSQKDGAVQTQWYENGNKDKTVTFSDLKDDCFCMEVKGKGKVKMQKQ